MPLCQERRLRRVLFCFLGLCDEAIKCITRTSSNFYHKAPKRAKSRREQAQQQQGGGVDDRVPTAELRQHSFCRANCMKKENQTNLERWREKWDAWCAAAVFVFGGLHLAESPR